MWESVERETDDDHEWIANPRQRFQFPGSRANEQSLARWLKFLGEAKSLLAGERLIPFWRTDDARTGINLRKIFTEPQRFDLVVWVQGTAAEPYLEKGDAIRPEALKRLIPEVGDWLILFGFGVN
jgi:hypothetical protein